MPIPAARTPLQASLLAALSAGAGAKAQVVSAQTATALGAAAATGLLPAFPSPIPLVPAGVAAAQAVLLAALSKQKGATIDATAKGFADAVSVVAPMAPPSGKTVLKIAAQAALSKGKGATQRDVAAQLASAVVAYYLAGGIL